ncbi:hypothetical protein NDU88_000975 [Pleurodeles waltl]|uniref:Uncharacterized protein n=1 Tax=Pleurodeles waltl TaxID=8319 RepID=A0AAV7TIT4_PLEWA|nr:hypothetical protein NDU88_000975 [Pleurodeles waltl]
MAAMGDLVQTLDLEEGAEEADSKVESLSDAHSGAGTLTPPDVTPETADEIVRDYSENLNEGSVSRAVEGAALDRALRSTERRKEDRGAVTVHVVHVSVLASTGWRLAGRGGTPRRRDGETTGYGDIEELGH